jgi:hypothetical protein
MAAWAKAKSDSFSVRQFFNDCMASEYGTIIAASARAAGRTDRVHSFDQENAGQVGRV